MPGRSVARRVVGACLIAALVATVSGTASATGAQDATLTGPGITGLLHITNVPDGPTTINVNRLVEASGTDYAVFRSWPSPLRPNRPEGSLTPRSARVRQEGALRVVHLGRATQPAGWRRTVRHRDCVVHRRRRPRSSSYLTATATALRSHLAVRARTAALHQGKRQGVGV